MRLGLYVLERVAWRVLGAFLLVEGLWVLGSVLLLSRREPIIGVWSVFHMAPLSAAYAVGPCLLAALAAGVGSVIADLGHSNQLTAANAAGIGPVRWLLPVVGLGLLVTPFSLYHQSEVFPLARAGKQAVGRMLLRSPEVCVRLLAADSGQVAGRWFAFRPLDSGTFDQFWGVELDSDGLPESVWRARMGRVFVPEARDVLRLEFEGVEVWQRGADALPTRLEAAAMRLDVPLRTLSARVSRSHSSVVREMTLGELRRFIDLAPEGRRRDRANAEWAGRIALGLSPIAIVFAAAAAGLFSSRFGSAGGFIAGLGVVSLLFLPLHNSCVLLVASGYPALLASLPPALILLGSLHPIARWRPT